MEPGGFCACSAISPLAPNWVLVILLTLRAAAVKTRVHFRSCQQQSVVLSSAECWRQSAFSTSTFLLTMQCFKFNLCFVAEIQDECDVSTVSSILVSSFHKLILAQAPNTKKDEVL